MAENWQSIGGAHRDMFLVGKNWTGPENVEAILNDNDDILAMRAAFEAMQRVFKDTPQ